MKLRLLLLALLGSSSAYAQVNPLATLVGAGINAARNSPGSARQQKENLFVAPATFGTHKVLQKRTPANKLPKADKGGTEIQAIEQLLAGCAVALQADSTALLLPVAQEKEFARLRANLEAFNAFWNTAPYSQEMSFYRQHDELRRRLARQAGSR